MDHIVVAHNAKFDIAMIEAEGLKVPKFICTLRVAREMDEKAVIPEYGLQFLRYFLELEVEAQAHDAAGDVKVLEAVFNRQFEKLKEGGLSDEEAINKMVEISSHPSLFKKFSFGKHKDKMVAEVAKTDRGYLEWLLKQKLENGEEDEDWLYTLRHYV
jgi:DNA polymerase III alpha subunit (gram-positive type)